MEKSPRNIDSKRLLSEQGNTTNIAAAYRQFLGDGKTGGKGGKMGGGMVDYNEREKLH